MNAKTIGTYFLVAVYIFRDWTFLKGTIASLVSNHPLIALAFGLSLLLHFGLRVYLEARRVSRVPGWRLRRLAEFCFSKKTFTQVLEPILSDMQKEHFEALATDRPWQARMVLVRGYWSFWSAVVAQLPISLTRRVFEIWKATKTGS